MLSRALKPAVYYPEHQKHVGVNHERLRYVYRPGVTSIIVGPSCAVMMLMIGMMGVSFNAAAGSIRMSVLVSDTLKQSLQAGLH